MTQEPKLYSEKFRKKIEESDVDVHQLNTDAEERLLHQIQVDVLSAETQKEDTLDETGQSTIDRWEDEYKMLRGGGLQWTTRMAYRSERKRKIRPNSENNFIHSAIENLTANLTAHKPEISIRARAEQKEQAQALTHMSNYNDYRNDFQSMWREAVRNFVSYGPICLKVYWDPEWIGGAGPDRFVGDVKITEVTKEEFLIDPAILHMERDLQRARFCGTKTRQFVDYVQKRWPKYAKKISADDDMDLNENEGTEYESVNLYEIYYRGFPEMVSPARKKELRERAIRAEEEGDFYKAQDLYDMADGTLEGVHLAYYCNDVLLEYVPYIYDHGRFPFAFKVRYKDPKNPWGYGEIMNTKIPQILHNKADEIEIEAMVKEGLGGGYYDEDAIDDKQLDNIVENGGRSGMWFAVKNILGIKERTGVKVPQSILSYKEHKQRMVETISANTPVAQGMSPGANVAFKTVAELGARTDIRTQQAADILKDLLIDVNQIRIQLFAQFYTEERYFRYTDTNKVLHEGTFKSADIIDEWVRDTDVAETGEAVQRVEKFLPDFDIEIHVMSKKPDDRNYHTNLAFALFERQLMAGKDLLYTLDEGFLPDTEEILRNKAEENQVMELLQKVQSLPEQIRPELFQAMEGAIDNTVDRAIQQMQQQAQMPMQQQGQIPQ